MLSNIIRWFGKLTANNLYTQFNIMNQSINSTITANGQKLIDFLDEKMHAGQFENNDLVQFIESVGKYLNLQTIADYANENKLSYNGVKNNRKIQQIFNVKFVIDND